MSGIMQALLAGGFTPAVPSQLVFEPAGQNLAMDQSWTVIAGVNSVCICIVSSGGGSITVKKNGVLIMSRSSFSQVGCDGGGNGGIGGGSDGGGGGAGGYAGNGGDAGVFTSGPTPSDGLPGAGGGGGGGGGGNIGIFPNPPWPAGDGGPVGLKGAGSNGFAGAGASPSTPSSSGGPGSNAPGGLRYGGGVSSGGFGWDGGGLGWKNNISVVPGDVLRFESNVPPSGANISGARLIYGAGRSYPSAAGDV